LATLEFAIGATSLFWALCRIEDGFTQGLVLTSFMSARRLLFTSQSIYVAAAFGLMRIIDHAAKEVDKFYAQSGDDRKAVNTGVFTMIYEFICSMVPDVPALSPSQKKKMQDYGTEVSALKHSVDLFKLFKQGLEWVRVEVLGLPPADADAKLLVDEMATWIESVRSLMSEDLIRQIMSNHDMAARLKMKLWEGHRLQTRATKLKIPSGALQSFTSTMMKLGKFEDTIFVKLRLDVGRVRPCFVHIFGTPGQGKTILSQILTADLYAALNPGVVLSKTGMVFDWNTDTEFWDGYFGQFALHADDIFQKDDAEERTRIAAELVHLVNDATYPLKMAVAEQKASNFFTSRLIVWTSNAPALPSNCHLEDVVAFNRRVDIRIEVKIRKEFEKKVWLADASGKMREVTIANLEKIRQEGKDCNPSVYHIYLYEEGKKREINYGELVQLALHVLKEYSNKEGSTWDRIIKTVNGRPEAVNEKVLDDIIKSRILETHDKEFEKEVQKQKELEEQARIDKETAEINAKIEERAQMLAIAREKEKEANKMELKVVGTSDDLGQPLIKMEPKTEDKMVAEMKIVSTRDYQLLERDGQIVPYVWEEFDTIANANRYFKLCNRLYNECCSIAKRDGILNKTDRDLLHMAFKKSFEIQLHRGDFADDKVCTNEVIYNAIKDIPHRACAGEIIHNLTLDERACLTKYGFLFVAQMMNNDLGVPEFKPFDTCHHQMLNDGFPKEFDDAFPVERRRDIPWGDFSKLMYEARQFSYINNYDAQQENYLCKLFCGRYMLGEEVEDIVKNPIAGYGSSIPKYDPNLPHYPKPSILSDIEDLHVVSISNRPATTHCRLSQGPNGRTKRKSDTQIWEEGTSEEPYFSQSGMSDPGYAICRLGWMAQNYAQKNGLNKGQTDWLIQRVFHRYFVENHTTLHISQNMIDMPLPVGTPGENYPAIQLDPQTGDIPFSYVNPFDAFAIDPPYETEMFSAIKRILPFSRAEDYDEKTVFVVEEMEYKLLKAPVVENAPESVSEELKDLVNTLNKNPPGSIKQNYELYKVSIPEHFWKIGAAILSVVSILGIGIAMYKIFTKVNLKAEALTSSGDPQTRTPNHRRTKTSFPKGKVINLRQMNAQRSDSNAESIILSVRKNLVKMEWTDKDQTERYGLVHGTMLKDRLGITALHFFANRPDELEYLRFETNKGEVFLVIVDDLVVKSIAEDLASFRIKVNNVPMFPDIMHHLNSAIDYNTNVSDVTLVRSSNEVSTSGTATLEESVTYTDRASNVEVELAKHAIVQISSSSGDCGSPYVLSNSRVPKKIIGLHVAGNGRKAVCHLLPSLDEIEAGLFSESRVPLKFPGALKVIKTVEKDEMVRMPNKTQIMPSLISDLLVTPPTTKPAALKPFLMDGAVRAPIQIGIVKFDKPSITLTDEDREIMHECAEALAAHIPKPVKPCILTTHQAINGVKHWKHMAKINFSASAGYGKQNRPGKGKWPDYECTQCNAQKLCDCKDAEYRPTKEFGSEIERDEQKIRRGEVPDWVFTMLLKDERRPIEKVDQGKTRLFSAAPHTHLVLTRKYFGALLEALRDDPSGTFSAVGLNPHSQQWKMLYDRLTRFGEATKFLPGDFEGYDATIPEIVSLTILEAVHIWFGKDITQEDHDAIDQLWKGTYWGKYIILEYIFTFEEGRGGSNPSGGGATIDYNNMGNVVVHSFSATKHARLLGKLTGLLLINGDVTKLLDRPGHEEYHMELICRARQINLDTAHYLCHFTPWTWWKDFEFTATGDDHVETYGGIWYTMGDKAYWISYLGMKYTDTKKRPLDSSLKWFTLDTLNEVTYLKRSFKPINGLVYAPLEFEVVVEIPHWIRDTYVDHRIATTQNCEASLREMFHYGKQAFDSYRRLLNGYLTSRGCPVMNVKSWHSLMSDFLGGGFGDLPNTIEAPELVASGVTLAPGPFSAESLSGTKRTSPEKEAPFVAEMMSSSVSEPDNKVESGITAFADINKVEELPSIGGLLINNDPYPDQGLTKVLTRNFTVLEYTWSGSDPRGTEITGGKFPFDLWSRPFITSILKNFKYFKADVKVSIRVNSTSFHQGQLLVAWVPNYNPTSTSVLRMHNLQTASQCECAIISASTPSVVEFTIPYVGPSTFIDLTKEGTSVDCAIGFYKVFVLSPLKIISSTATPHVHFTVNAEFVNPKVMGMRYVSEMQSERDTRDMRHTMKDVLNVTADACETISKVGFNVPQGIAMGARLISASMSKNTSVAAPTTTLARPTPDHCHTSGLELTQKLSADPENHVAVDHTIFRTDVDYDEFRHYKTLPGIVKHFSWDDTKTPGQLISSFPVYPSLCESSSETDITDATYTVGWVAPIGNLVRFFQYWTGSMKFSLHFCTSKFTTSRIRIVHLDDVPPATDVGGGNVVSEVCDITGDTVYNFTVPYMKDRLWLNSIEPGQTTDSANTIFNGWIGIYLINTVTSGDSVSDTGIDCNMWMSGASDFRVARPTSRSMNANTSTLKKQPWYPTLPFEKKFYSEMSTSPHFPREIFKTEFKSLIPAKATMIEGINMGEEITRWTQLFKRYSAYYSNSLAPANSEFAIAVNTIVTGGRLATENFVTNSNKDDAFPCFMNSFLFWRGSMRLKFLPLYSAQAGSLRVFNNHDGMVSSTITASPFEGATYGDTITRLPVEVEIPFYFPYVMTGTSLPIEPGTQNYHFETHYGVRYDWYSPTGNQITMDIYQAVGDDFSIGYPSSVPGWVMTYTAPTSTPKSSNNNTSRAATGAFKPATF